MTRHRLPRPGVLAGVCVLVLAGISQAAGQFLPGPAQSGSAQGSVFPPPPGQSTARQDPAFPPPPGASRASAQQDSAFPPPPAPGQRAAAPSAGGFSPAVGGFGSPASGGFGSPASGGFGSAPGGFGGGSSAGPSEAQKVCLTFPALRDDVEKGAAGIKAASERKASRDEVCPLFKAFAAKEEKMVKFLVTHQRLCGVPPKIIGQMKTNHAKTIQIRNVVCSAGPAAPPPGPSLSDALGGPIIADDESARKPGRGTFDTLTGNVLSR